MELTLSKIVALLLAAAYVIAAGVGESLSFAATVAVGVLLPLACIWFAEPNGELDRRLATVQPPLSLSGLARCDDGLGLAGGRSPVRID